MNRYYQASVWIKSSDKVKKSYKHTQMIGEKGGIRKKKDLCSAVCTLASRMGFKLDFRELLRTNIQNYGYGATCVKVSDVLSFYDEYDRKMTVVLYRINRNLQVIIEP